MYRETGVTSEIRKISLRRLGHVERRPEERSVKKVFKNIPEGRRFVGKPRKRKMDDVENYLKGSGVTGCTKIARDTNAWKSIVKEAKVLHGPYSQWRRRVRRKKKKRQSKTGA